MIPALNRFFSIRKEKNTISVDREIKGSSENSSGFECCHWLPSSLGSGFMRKIRLKSGMTLFIEDLIPRRNFISAWKPNTIL